MKKLVFIFFAITIITSCNNDDDSNTQDSEIVGDWKLIEVLVDPGGGSGTFQAVDSDKIITFYNDGTVSSNGDLCTMFAEVESPSSGTYSELNASITPEVCQDVVPNWNYSFEIEGHTLIINYPCFEACREKYQKL